MKLAPLQRKSSHQTRQTDRSVDNPTAAATSPVLTQKYVPMAPTSGFASSRNVTDPMEPPSPWYTIAVAPIVMASADALNTVRYTGYRCFTWKVHCATTPATATIVARRGPSSSSAIRSAAYDTDSVEPLERAIGSVTFHVEVTHPSTSSTKNSAGRGTAWGKSEANTAVPPAMMMPTYSCAARGSSRHDRPPARAVTALAR